MWLTLKMDITKESFGLRLEDCKTSRGNPYQRNVVDHLRYRLPTGAPPPHTRPYCTGQTIGRFCTHFIRKCLVSSPRVLLYAYPRPLSPPAGDRSFAQGPRRIWVDSMLDSQFTVNGNQSPFNKRSMIYDYIDLDGLLRLSVRLRDTP